MGKLNKKLENRKKPQRQIVTNKNKIDRIATKDCFVTLIKMSQRELKMYKNAEEIISKSFDLRITDDCLHFGKQKQRIVDSTLNIEFSNKSELKLKLNKILDDCCTISKPLVKPKSLAQLTEAAWRKCKLDNKTLELENGQIVLGKMRGYSPWPARLCGFSKNKKRVQLYFFGTNNNGSVDIGETVAFEFTTEVIKLLLLRPLPSFYKAVREAECVLGIAEDQSITNQAHALEN